MYSYSPYSHLLGNAHHIPRLNLDFRKAFFKRFSSVFLDVSKTVFQNFSRVTTTIVLKVSVRTGAPSSLVLLLLEGSHDVHVYSRRPGSRVRLGRARRTGPHRRWPSIANRSAKAIATTISCTIFHSINSRKCTTKNITVLATARTAPRPERAF